MLQVFINARIYSANPRFAIHMQANKLEHLWKSVAPLIITISTNLKLMVSMN